MKLKMITPPASMPVTLQEAKDFFRVIGTDEDDEITRVIKMATEQAEIITNRQLNIATYEGYLDAFPVSVKIPKPPLVSVQKVEYIDVNGSAQAFTDYLVDELVEPAVIQFNSTPTDVRDEINSVIVTFQCGYTEVPASIQSYVLNAALTRFENREGEVVGTITDSKFAANARKLLDSYRVIPV
ncbi:head-tail connector protein [Sulfurovum mangrovi]|uniref:head-tail connector protein n=1 Tax=Sulfurovum mangrovi TaxID=2893889 RepID=UPI001E54DC2F|nr:phage head-tail connector protein [Sulfurovum mangrovi]UFH59832.1 phage head-tail connector protein [Sulfurovum mangrovi]UFH59883.1 phage head-tail connector protein [Sulfurovum mangrovi]